MQGARAERFEQGLEVLRILLGDAPEERRPGRHGLLLAQGADQRVLGLADELLAFREQPVVVLVQPALRVVFDLAGVVPDDEALVHGRARGAAPAAASHLERLEDLLPGGVPGGLVHDLLAEGFVRRVADALHEVLAVLVQRLEHLADGGEHGLRVGQRQALPRQALAPVELLFGPQHVLDEVLLEPLVREVDAKLLEGVAPQVLEAVDVQDAHVRAALELVVGGAAPGGAPLAGPQATEGIVDPQHGPIEESLVNGFDEALEGLPEASDAPGHLVEGAAPSDSDLLLRQPRPHLVGVHAEQLRSPLQGLEVDVDGLVVVLQAAAVRALGRGVGRRLPLEVAQVDQAREHADHASDVVRAQANGPEGVAEPFEIDCVAGLKPWQGLAARAGEQAVRLALLQTELRHTLIVQPSDHLVKAVVRPLPVAVHDDARALEQVRRDARVDERALVVEEHAVVLPETRRVAVPHGHRVAHGLQDRLRLQDPRLDALRVGRRRAGGEGQELHDDLRRLGLPGAGLARDQQALVAPLAHQGAVRCVGDGVRVRRQRPNVFAAVPRALVHAV
mmetsp:Transcript_84524/g.258067  ORF Transcript_84524/g.258067 Transcript_84524/m.258067 type:complete len:563 (-) Transcript_84524:445-2133(-)